MIDPIEAAERARRFRSLHEQAEPLLLVNVWDVASARAAVAAGARALGTTSFGIALDHGVNDGELLPLEVGLDVVRQIVEAVPVPVTFDLEAGHGENARAVGDSVSAAIEAGVAGINLEDGRPGQPGALFSMTEQTERLASARAAADRAGVPIFLNARCDAYFGAQIDDARRRSEAIERAGAYALAGADGLFLPGLIDLETISAIVAAVSLPLNVMVMPGLPDASQLATAGVKRVSQGGALFLAAVGAIVTTTREFLSGQLLPPVEEFTAGYTTVPALTRELSMT
jgi:2-methylisocitrate lyase-like PEP mutase family enzyme